MIHIKWLLLSTILFMSITLQAQVKHNFNMDPENTDCHEMPEDLQKLHIDSVINIITAKKYRFTQEVTLSRYRSPRSLAYFSCDGSTGFIIAHETDTEVAVFKEVPKTVWNTLINHKDPLGYYSHTDVQKHLISFE